MHRFVIGIFVIGALAATHAEAASLSFSDDFEGASLNPFWSTSATSGVVVFPSTAQAHGGTQSVQLDSIMSGSNKEIILEHAFGETVYGTLSIWMYDSGADDASGNYVWFHALTPSLASRSIGVYDYNTGPGANYIYNDGAVESASSIARTQAWHHLELEILPTLSTLSIDGTVVSSGANSLGGFDRVMVRMSAPAARPAMSFYFDDFQFAAVPEPSNFVLLSLGTVVLLGWWRFRRN